MPLISVKNLEKTYYAGAIATCALRGVSLTIEQGEFVGIMGPSGSGKSTLLHILGFLDKLTRGEYLFQEKTAYDYSEDEIAKLRNEKIGFVFQVFNLLPRTTVFENVKLPLLYSHVQESHWHQRVHDAIEAVGLSHRIHHESSQLSGGEKQRVAIARALVNTPSVLFADEPTGNLDSQSGITVMKILQNLNYDKKHTIILITHSEEAASYAKRIIRLRDGLIV